MGILLTALTLPALYTISRWPSYWGILLLKGHRIIYLKPLTMTMTRNYRWVSSRGPHQPLLRQELPDLSSDRMCVVQIDIGGRLVYVISVYLPHAACKVSDLKVEMSQLENLIDNCKTMGEVVAIGDMNVHFGSEYGGRCWGSTSTNGKRLMSCLKSHDMCVVDIVEKGIGEGYTFASTNSMSYIDHCAVFNSLFSVIEQCNVLEDDIRNTLDHLATNFRWTWNVLPCNATDRIGRSCGTNWLQRR